MRKKVKIEEFWIFNYQNFYFLVAVAKLEVCIDCNPIANQGWEHATKNNGFFNLFDLKWPLMTFNQVHGQILNVKLTIFSEKFKFSKK